MRIDIVTFNSNEAAAVDRLFDEIAGDGSAWGRRGAHGLQFQHDPSHELRHEAAPAQGNVVAASVLARLYSGSEERPDYVVFYGCAGAVESSVVGSAFIARSANYISLGTVVGDGPATEKVTLKNKWIVHTEPSEVDPLPQLQFGSPSMQKVLEEATGLQAAAIASTDKVLKIDLSQFPTPTPSHGGLPAPRFAKADWSYGEALRLLDQANVGTTTLVEMEGYGVASVSGAADLLERVVVLRVPTDCLADHANSDTAQAKLLLDGRAALLRVLHVLLWPGVGVPA